MIHMDVFMTYFQNNKTNNKKLQTMAKEFKNLQAVRDHFFEEMLENYLVKNLAENGTGLDNQVLKSAYDELKEYRKVPVAQEGGTVWH